MKKHNHPFVVGERVWDDSEMRWAVIAQIAPSPDEGSNFLVLKDETTGRLWEALYENVYQIAPGLRTACSGDIVCYEHNETQDDYPYYCPARQENFFSVELIETYEADTPEGTAYELVQKLQDAVLASKNPGISVCVEDEEGRLEYIEHIWYDEQMQMIRMSLRDVVFEDAPQD